MRKPPNFTDDDVLRLLEARKILGSKLKDNSQKPNQEYAEIIYKVSRLDDPTTDIRLRFKARRVRPVLIQSPYIKPSAAILWHDYRIRGIDWKLRHDIRINGALLGTVEGWHEHLWSLANLDKEVIDVNGEVKKYQRDFLKFIRFCMLRWGIELPDVKAAQRGLFDEEFE